MRAAEQADSQLFFIKSMASWKASRPAIVNNRAAFRVTGSPAVSAQQAE
jgi:hypothetical protein